MITNTAHVHIDTEWYAFAQWQFIAGNSIKKSFGIVMVIAPAGSKGQSSYSISPPPAGVRRRMERTR